MTSRPSYEAPKKLPLPLKCWPSRPESGSPLCFERRRILGAAQRACGHDDALGLEGSRLRVDAVLVRAVVMDEVAAAGRPLDEVDVDAGVHLRAGAPGDGQVVHRQRILGADVAAGEAVPAIGARRLLDVVRVRTTGKIHCQLHRLEGVAPAAGALAREHLDLGERSRPRVHGGAEHPLGELVMGGHRSARPLALDRRRPARAAAREVVLVRTERDRCVDQAGATEPTALQDVDVGERQVLEETLRSRVGAHAVVDLLQRVREGPGPPLGTALEQANLLPGEREPGGHDRAAVARADDRGRALLCQL